MFNSLSSPLPPNNVYICLYFLIYSMSNVFFVNGIKDFLNSHLKNICKKTMTLHVLNLWKFSDTTKYLKIELFMEYWFFLKLGRVGLKTDEFKCLYFFLTISFTEWNLNLHVKVQVSFSDRLVSVVCLLTLHIFKFLSSSMLCYNHIALRKWTGFFRWAM